MKKKYNHISTQIGEWWIEQTPELDELEDQWVSDNYELINN